MLGWKNVSHGFRVIGKNKWALWPGHGAHFDQILFLPILISRSPLWRMIGAPSSFRETDKEMRIVFFA